MLTRELAGDVRAAVEGTPGFEHKALASLIHRIATDAVEADEEVVMDWEGNSARQRAQGQTYKLLGTATHPDAAVLEPFRCAIEFDREPKTGHSHFKECLLKAACHVLSGAYDAVLFVYTLRRADSTADTYLTDYKGGEPQPHTARLLKMLIKQRVVIAIVPTA